MRALVSALACALLHAASASAAPQSSANGVRIDGPPPPVAPATINRDREGRATVRAIKLIEPLRVDGNLDEPVYSENPPFGEFIQVAPKAGASSSERTDVWVMFDAAHVYVAAKCWDSSPPSEWIANELRRDTNQLRNNETFGVMFDTFYDRRNGFMFYPHPLGAAARRYPS